MADFNGDRFPDFVRGGFVQYTTPRGGISAQAAEIGDFTHSKTSNQGGSINGTYTHPLANRLHLKIQRNLPNNSKILLPKEHKMLIRQKQHWDSAEASLLEKTMQSIPIPILMETGWQTE